MRSQIIIQFIDDDLMVWPALGAVENHHVDHAANHQKATALQSHLPGVPMNARPDQHEISVGRSSTAADAHFLRAFQIPADTENPGAAVMDGVQSEMKNVPSNAS